MVNTEIVPVYQIDNAFEHVAAGLQRACERSGGDLTASYLFEQCRSSAALLVVTHDDTGIVGAVVLRFENWSGKRVLRTLGLWCSKKGAWEALNSKTHEIGKLYGATSLIAEGRKGWERRYPNAKLLRQLYEVTL